MIISGDISVNPGPVKHPCGGCQRPVAKTHRAVQCDVCYYWWHIKCANISPATYTDMCGSDDPWVCNECNSFRFSESFFEKSICVAMDSDNKNQNENVDDIFDELKDIKKKHPNKFICSYININSFRNKFGFIKDLLISNTCDMLTIAETKLDESFNSAQFQIENFHLWRADRTANGGGLLTYIKSDLPSDRKHKLECQIIESIFTEIVLKNEKWIICGLYRPPSMSDKEFSNDFIQTFDQLSVKYDNILILGDLNYNMLLDNSKSTPSNNVCDIFDFSNLIKKATCFTKDALPTLIDVILTNKPNKCQNATHFNCGLSDYHNLISVQLKGEIPKLKKDNVTYRSFKNFDHEKFLQELQSEQLDVITEHSNVETAYHNFETTFIKVVDKNIPLKKRRYITHPASFMNKRLRQEIYKKRTLHNKFLKQKTN